MSIQLFSDKHLTPAEGEVAVKTYHCTALDPIFAWFGIRINGYLTVTNKRLLYYAHGVTGYGMTGNSRSCVEVWLPDACNITQDIGTRYSIPRLILALVISLAVGAGANVALGLGWGQFMLSGSAGLATLRLIIFLQLVLAVFCVVQALTTPYDKIARLIFSAAGVGTLLNLHAVLLLLYATGGIARTYVLGNWIIGAAAGVQFLVSLYFFVRRWYFHVKVSGKNSSMRGSPINISADSIWSRINVASSYAKNMAPAVDSAAMFKELGAIVADIQTLGDFGIKKWQDATPPAAQADPLTVAPMPTPRTLVMRYAGALIGAAAVFIVSEGSLAAHRRAVAEALAHATNVRAGLVASKPHDGARWAPNLMAKANAQETAGQSAFDREDYKEASAFWEQATAEYKVASEAVRLLQMSEQSESNYNNHLRFLITNALGKSLPARSTFIEPATLAELSSFMERNAADEWNRIKESAGKAEAFKKAEKGAEAQAQWLAADKALEEARAKIDNAKRQSTQR